MASRYHSHVKIDLDLSSTSVLSNSGGKHHSVDQSSYSDGGNNVSASHLSQQGFRDPVFICQLFCSSLS